MIDLDLIRKDPEQVRENLARRGDDSRLIPVAAAATVVTAAGTLPPELAFWHTLAGPPVAARGGAR